jgi:Ca-activated chloride channel family protein
MDSGIDESLLTAYALDELSGAERAAVAAHLAMSEEARRYVADIRATAHMLSDELTREHFGELNDLQHMVIERKLEEMLERPSLKFRHPVRHDRLIFSMSLAASIVIVGGVITAVIPFVYRQVGQMTSTQAPKSDPAPAFVEKTPDNERAIPNPNMAEPPNPDNMTLTDVGPDATPADALPLPQPDDRLVKSGGGPAREEISQETPPMIGPHSPDDHVVPRTPGRNPSDVKVATNDDPAKNSVQPSSPVKPNASNQADLPVDKVAPEKVHRDIGGTSTASVPDEGYSHLLENRFIEVAKYPVSGYSAGVDTASYSNIRRFLNHGKLPPADAVRIEEMLNYFPVRAPMVAGDVPLGMQVEIGSCPWEPAHRLARVSVQALELSPDARPSVNLVFVVDVSKSMRSEKTKLPLLKLAMHQLVGKLSVRDRLSIVAYAEETGVVLPPTPVEDRQAIWAAIERIDNGGVMTGGQGMGLPYDLATRAFIRGGVNRVILATDGNWNVGITGRLDLENVIRDKSHNGVSLTVLGVGMNNLQDATLQKIAAAGNGSYAYIDTLEEARKVLADQVTGALVVVARDVKVQVKFNPAAADSYRLIGYERRALTKDELNSQSKRGGELGAGQCVTALYEVIPPKDAKASVYRPTDVLTAAVSYVDPNKQAPRALQAAGEDRGVALPRTSTEFRFSAAVAEFGLLLHDSDYKGNASYTSVLNHAVQAAGPDDAGYRQEFVGLIRKAAALSAARQ